VNGAGLPTDAPYGLQSPGAAADLAAESVRVVNRLTIGAPSPGVPGWEDVSDLYRVLGDLRLLAERLPQVFEQTARHLERPGHDGCSYKSDTGTSQSPDILVATAVVALANAERDVRQVGINLSAAHTAVAHLYT
jgi:hypothetical protein